MRLIHREILGVIILICLFCSTSGYSSDDFVPDSTNTNTRGIEREEVSSEDPLRSMGDILIYLPRTTISYLLYGTGRGAYHLSDPDLIQKVESLLYFYKHQFGWYPNANIVSDHRSAFGAGVFYKVGYFSSSISSIYTAEDKWKLKSKLSHSSILNNKVLKTTFYVEFREDDDREFSGFGAHPLSDSRNSFLENRTDNIAVFGRERSRIGLDIGIRTSDAISFSYTGFYENLTLSPVDNQHSIEKVFLVNQDLFSTRFERLINEISFRFDSRENINHVSPGNRFETYAGLSHGLTDPYNGEIFFYGFDAISFIPIIKRNRIVAPRLAVNAASGMDSDNLMEFQFYPGHSTFRGASTRKQIRTDSFVIVPSIDYIWPLNSFIRASLFADAIVATNNLRDITINNTPNAYGWSISVHGDHEDVASFRISTGTQGLRLKLIIGFALDDNER